MRKHTYYSMKYRWTAVVLSLALSVGCSPLQALAIEDDMNVISDVQELPESIAGGEGTEAVSNTDESDSDVSDTNASDINDGNGDSVSAGDGGNIGVETEDSTDKTDHEGADTEDDADYDEGTGAGGEDDANQADNAGAGGVDDPDKEGDAGTGAEGDTDITDNAGTGTDSISENDAGSVSENDLVSVSENNLFSISENSLDQEWAVLVKEAEEAFSRLLANKDLMALIYHVDSYDARREAERGSLVAATLEIGQTVYIKGITITEEDVWYHVQYWQNGVEGTGYVQSYYLAYSDEEWLAWEEEYLHPVLMSDTGEYGRPACGMKAFSMMPYGTDDSDIAAFPKSYQSALQSLKDAHPNWTFVPMNTGLDFDASVTGEMKGDTSLIQKTDSNAAKGWVGELKSAGWYYATRPAVVHYMDPRNFLTETYIFQFEQLTFNSSYHTEAAVQSFLNNTFMKGVLPDDDQGRTYAGAFYEIGKSRKLSPIHLASRVYQEQGKGTSGLISGTYPGYEGYYNFFNVNANGDSEKETIENGLKHAKEKGWDTRYKSLDGGAALIGLNFILKYQDTLYLQRFNVDKNSPYTLYTHQYMQNIQAPASEAISTKKMYENSGSLNSAFVFKIPVYENMPEDGDEPGGGDVPGGSDTPKDEDRLDAISLDRKEIRMRRPDTVVEDMSGLSDVEKEENISTVSLQVSFDPAGTTKDRTIVWVSSNPRIASVRADLSDSSRAVVTAVGAGEATITAKAYKAGGLTAECKVYVSAPITGITLTNPNAKDTDTKERTTLLAGQSVNLAAEYWPKDTTSNTKITWSTSNPKVATVQDGRVEAVGEDPETNIAVITASVSGCDQGYKAQHTVVVENCTVTFMARDGETVLKKLQVPYGAGVPQKDFPEEETVEDGIFIGWYTGRNGTGSKFDEKTVIYKQNTILHPYYEEQGKGFYVLPVGDQAYTGSAIRPSVQVYDGITYEDGSRELIELVYNKDYTVSYRNNRNVNEEGKARPTITVRGKGNYTGTEYVYFDIVPKPLTDADIVADDFIEAYSGRVIKSAPVVYRDGKKLVKNTHYTVDYPQTGAGAYKSAGTYPVVITGKGGYTGKITVYETITNDVLMSKVSIKRIPNQTYRSDQVNKGDGSGIKPEALEVTYKRELLTESTDGGVTGDYTVSYKDNMAVGTATAIITGVKGSGFMGSKSITYKIVGVSIARAKVEGLENKEYPGNDVDKEEIYGKVLQTPGAYKLTIDGRTLVESTDGGITGDYVVSYEGAAKKGAVKAGTAVVLFEGINEFTGQIRKTYKITGCDISSGEGGQNAAVTMKYYTQDAPGRHQDITRLSEIVTPYVKGGSKPVVLLYYNGVALVPGKDYTMKYSNNNALTPAGSPEGGEKMLPMITVTGKGNFKGSIAGNYSITDGLMGQDSGKVTMAAKDVAYKDRKGAYKGSVTLTDCSGLRLAAGRDYDRNLSYTYEHDTELSNYDGSVITRKAGDPVGEEDTPKIGTVIRVTAHGIGFYAGTREKEAQLYTTYRIVAADISKARVKVQPKEYCNGREVTLTKEDLTVTVSGSDKPLVYGVDYVIDSNTYVNNTNRGRAAVTIRGVGNYGGEKKVVYTVGAKALVWWKNLLR